MDKRYSDEQCKDRGAGLTHVMEAGINRCVYCRLEVYRASEKPRENTGGRVCSYLVCGSRNTEERTVGCVEFSDAGVPTAIKTRKLLCQGCTDRIQLGVSAGLTLRVTKEGWLWFDNTKAIMWGW